MLAGESLIAIVNPRAGRDRKGRFIKRHKAHRNPHRKGHKKHRGGKHRNPRLPMLAFHNKRRRHRNPRFRLPGMGNVGHVFAGAIAGAGGALALDLAMAYGAPYLPAALQPAFAPGWGRNFTRLAGAFGIGWLSRFVVSRDAARGVTLGAVTIVMYDIAKQLANQYVLPAGSQLGGEDGSYPYAGYYPYLTGLAHGGSQSTDVGPGMAGLRGYLKGPGIARTTRLPRARSTVSAFIEPEHASSSMGADLEV